jgi:hypothetical protein
MRNVLSIDFRDIAGNATDSYSQKMRRSLNLLIQNL